MYSFSNALIIAGPFESFQSHKHKHQITESFRVYTFPCRYMEQCENVAFEEMLTPPLTKNRTKVR